jgi:exo-beta-1,3-glucanase (GH17 family)
LCELISALFVMLILLPVRGAPASLDDGPVFNNPAIAYSPRGYNPTPEATEPSNEQLVSDLKLLSSVGFRSLVTYGSQGSLSAIPELARAHGFDGLIIMGIWDPSSEEEWSNATAAAPFVDAYCVGNEGLGTRYEPQELSEAMEKLRNTTGKPVSTSERIENYLQGPYREWLLRESDWLYPIVHPVWHGHLDPERAVNWIVVRHDYLAATSGRQVIVKEAGFPSAGPTGASEKEQAVFFQRLSASGIPFFYFEAFDQPWKRSVLEDGDIESTWGLFDDEGSPKEVVFRIEGVRTDR